MPRNVTAAMLAELGAGTVRPVVFVEAEFTNGWARVWSGLGPMSWNGYTWDGVGDLLSIGQVSESDEIKADNVTLTLNGLSPDMLPRLLNNVRQGKPVYVWFGFLDAAGNVINSPALAFAGRMDVPTIEDGGDQVAASVNVENRLIDLDRSRERRFTDQDQRSDYPLDRGFEYVAALQDWSGAWMGPTSIGRCPCADQYLDDDVPVRNAWEFVGRHFEVLEHGEKRTAPLLAVRGITLAECVRLVARNGRAMSCSIDTPIDLPDGSQVMAPEMEGRPIATDGGRGTPLEWDVIARVEYLGWREVVPLDFAGRTFGCGETPKGRLFTHNMSKEAPKD